MRTVWPKVVTGAGPADAGDGPGPAAAPARAEGVTGDDPGPSVAAGKLPTAAGPGWIRNDSSAISPAMVPATASIRRFIWSRCSAAGPDPMAPLAGAAAAAAG